MYYLTKYRESNKMFTMRSFQIKRIFFLLSLMGLVFILPLDKLSDISFLNFCQTCPIYMEGAASNVSLGVFVQNILLAILYYTLGTIPIFAFIVGGSYKSPVQQLRYPIRGLCPLHRTKAIGFRYTFSVRKDQLPK